MKTESLLGSAWLALLWIKAGFEQRWMAAQQPGHADCMKATQRFVPWLV